MDYFGRVADNIFPVSREKSDVRTALREWEYHDTHYDTGYASEICQLCNQEDIRYQFEIVNKYNGNELLIGSQCIKRYDDISVVDDTGVRLSKDLARKKVDRDRRKLITDAQTNSVLSTLVRLSRVKEGEQIDFEAMLETYREHGAFSPRQLFAVQFRASKNNIPCQNGCFKVRLRGKWKQQLMEMDAWRVAKIYELLSPQQRTTVMRARPDAFPSDAKR